MSELVERYVHQVGRYLPKKERADIEAELRSLIQDQLDDRFQASPTEADIASVLAEFGDPRQMAASYNREQYLVGPDLYPYMMMILRHVWVIVPTIVIFLNIFGAITSSQQTTLLNLVVETLVTLVQTTLIFSAVVVLIFGFIQRIITELDEKEKAFDPLTLPKVDDPHTVDRFEATFGIIIGAFVLLILGYFLQVGGLTLRFNLNDPGDVIPVPMTWLILLIGAIIAMLIMGVWVMRRNRWNVTLWVMETILELFGMIGLYFVIYEPLLARILIAVPSLANVSFIDNVPEIIVVITALITLVGRGSRLVALWNYRNSSALNDAVKSRG
jgi:hypothetical protein